MAALGGKPEEVRALYERAVEADSHHALPVDERRCNLLVGNLEAEPRLALVGHLDTVPACDLDRYAAEEAGDTIRGLGAADMKGSLAAMVTACERLLATGAVQGRIAFLLTSDEEGPSVDGTVRLVEWLQQRGQRGQDTRSGAAHRAGGGRLAPGPCAVCLAALPLPAGGRAAGRSVSGAVRAAG